MKKFFSTMLLMLLAVIPALAQEIVIDEISVEEGAYMVNKDCMTLRFKLNNNTGFDMAAGEYQVAVNVGGKFAGEPAATKAIANGTYESFVVHATPHVAGENLPVEVVVKGWGGANAQAALVDVAAEIPAGEITVGAQAQVRDVDYYVPLNTYYDFSQTEIVYTAEDLNLTEGTVMTGFSFKGYREDERLVPVKVWVEQTEDVVPASTDQMTMYSTESMIKVYDGDYQFRSAGDEYEHVTVFSVDFPEPIVYAGKSLRLIVQTEKATLAKKTNVEVDKSKSGHVATRYADNSFDNMAAKSFKNNSYGTPYYMPLLYLAIEKEPSVVSGTVTISDVMAETTSPFAGAELTFKHDNVMYFATADANGQYSVEVCQDKLKYEVTVEGSVTTFPQTDVLEMEGVDAQFDVEVVKAFGAYILSADIPETGVVNNPVTVKLNLANYEAFEFNPSNTVISLVKGEVEPDDEEYDVLATADDYAIDAFDNDELTITFTPHETWSDMLGVLVIVNGVPNCFQGASFEVKPEMASGDFTIAEGMETANETTAPIRLYSTHSYSQTVITADMLQGLAPGSKIIGLKFESAQGSNSKDFMFDVKAWAMNTTDDTEAEAIDPHSADFQQVYEGTLQQRHHGNYNDGATTYEEFLVLTFDEPFVYTGQNIRIAMRADIEGSGYQQTYFKAVKNVRGTFTKSSDNPKIDGVPVDIMDYTWASSKAQTPVFTFVVDNANILTGKVVDADSQEAIAGAVVTLVADDEDVDVLYTAASDEEGNIELSVVQNGYDYTLTAAAEGYASVTQQIEAGFGSFSLGNIELVKESTTAISDVEQRQTVKRVYDLMGREVMTVRKGITIVNGSLRCNK